MNKKLLYILVSATISCLPFGLSAQAVRISYLFNPQLAWLHSNSNTAQSGGVVTGFQTGLETDFFFAEHYAFSAGLQIHTYGGKVDYSDTLNLKIPGGSYTLTPDNQVKYKFQYLSIPLGLKLKTIEVGYTTFWIHTGVTPMINIGSAISDDREQLIKEDGKEETGLLNMNYYIKAGVEYSLGGNTALIGGLAYNHGFMDATTPSTDNLFLRSFSLNLGILF